MSDIIFKTDGKEGFRIPSPFSNNYYHLPKCPETKLEVKEMTEYQPTPQTPEQVDEGLRNAFRQAIKDGVMDATPYLKQMNSNKEIELLKQEIKMLKSKLAFLEELENHRSPVEEAYKDWWGQYPQLETDSEYDEMRWQGFQAGFQAAYEEKVREDNYYDEVEKHKSQPRMEFDFDGKFEVVSYNGEVYYRLEFTDEVYWCKRKYDDGVMVLVDITDGETRRLLEGVWFNEVRKGKYGPDEPHCPDEPEYYDEVEWDRKDNPKPMDEVVDRLVKKYQAQKLLNMLKVQLDYDGMVCDDIVDIVEDWLPKEQISAGSQNVNTELLVDGFNDCVRKMKEMLR